MFLKQKMFEHRNVFFYFVFVAWCALETMTSEAADCNITAQGERQFNEEGVGLKHCPPSPQNCKGIGEVTENRCLNCCFPSVTVSSSLVSYNDNRTETPQLTVTPTNTVTVLSVSVTPINNGTLRPTTSLGNTMSMTATKKTTTPGSAKATPTPAVPNTEGERGKENGKPLLWIITPVIVVAVISIFAIYCCHKRKIYCFSKTSLPTERRWDSERVLKYDLQNENVAMI